MSAFNAKSLQLQWSFGDIPESMMMEMNSKLKSKSEIVTRWLWTLLTNCGRISEYATQIEKKQDFNAYAI